MPSIRHHLTIAEAFLMQANAHLESAFEHVAEKEYDPRWSLAIDDVITKAAQTAIEVFNINKCIEPPAADLRPSDAQVTLLKGT